MNSPLTAPDAAATGGRGLAHLLVNLLVALVVIAVAAATFVFSYDGVHALALLGGVSTQLARYYPGLFDAVLVIACVAVVVLRDGRWLARLWAWLVLIVVLAAIGTTDVLHAMDYTLRHRVTEGVVAAAPAVAVLLAFSLLITMLRQPKGHPADAGPRGGQEQHQATQPVAALPLDLPALPASLPEVRPAPAAIALPAGPAQAAPPREEDRVDRPAPEPEPPTRAVPALNGVPPVPGGTVPPAPQAPPATEPIEVITTAAPAKESSETGFPEPEPATAESPEAEPAEPESADDEPAPPTAMSPALAAPAADEPAKETPSTRSGIRYAGGGTRANKPRPASAATLGGTPDSTDYWDSEEAGQFAGLVYAAREEGDTAAEPGAAGAEGAGEDPETSTASRQSPELDDDAPPFATAPFAPVPRLNRVRSTPAPPADEEDD